MALSLKLTSQPPILKMTEEFLNRAGEVILGKEEILKLSLCCFLARGHMLIEDIPGMGKTTLVKLLAKAFGLQFRRIQFTSDLLPSDILGISIFDSNEQRFRFHHGPIFGQLVLGDELNRASPKTQSAFLQAMEEHRVTVDGQTHALPDPFFLVATQNPRQQIGTFPLPESQVDRFLMRLSMGYPSRKAEEQLLMGAHRQSLIDNFKPIITANELVEMQQQAENIPVSPALISYVQDLLGASRSQSSQISGLSPRAGIDLVAAAKAWTFMHGRSIVLPEDIQAVGVSVINHRICASIDTHFVTAREMASELIRSVHLQ